MKKKYMLSSTLVIVMAIALIIAVNVFVSALSKKFSLKIDMTSAGIYSLSEQTKEYLKTYDTPTDIYMLAGEAEQDDNIRAVLDRYSSASRSINVTNINMAENPTFGKKYVTDGKSLSANSVIVDGGERFRVLSLTELYGFNSDTGKVTSLQAESKLTSALKYVSADTALKACIVTGHGETEALGIKAKLENENYTVTEVNLLTEELPEDAGITIIYAPKTDFTPDETAKLDRYLADGGNAQFYFDANSSLLTGLYDYIAMWGIRVTDKLAVDNDASREISVSGTPMALIAADFCPHELTNSIVENKRTVAYFKYSKALEKIFENSGSTVTAPLLKTSKNTYLSADTEDTSNKEDGTEGEKYIGILSTNAQYGSSVYVSGTTMLMSIDPERIANNFGFANFDYFMNITGFMQGNTDTYTVPAKTLTGNTISVGVLQGFAIGVIFAVIIPLAILIAGIVVWIRRRHL